MTPTIVPCSSCLFWVPSPGYRAKYDINGRPVTNVRVGYCHRRAPVLGHNGGGRLYPETDEQDGCGDGAR